MARKGDYTSGSMVSKDKKEEKKYIQRTEKADGWGRKGKKKLLLKHCA